MGRRVLRAAAGAGPTATRETGASLKLDVNEAFERFTVSKFGVNTGLDGVNTDEAQFPSTRTGVHGGRTGAIRNRRSRAWNRGSLAHTVNATRVEEQAICVIRRLTRFRFNL